MRRPMRAGHILPAVLVNVLRDGSAASGVTVVPENANGQPLFMVGRTGANGQAGFDLAVAS